MVIVDTNIWLEQLLGQARAAEVGEFLAGMPPDSLLMTDFTLHSIGVILTRLRRPEVLIQFVDDVFGGDAVELVSVEPDSMARVVEVINQFRLDFDDAYQYVAAE
jgi:predicted nucleic acid-binding protein